ncbi:hypothetical protein ACJ41O_014083 [Fusarium nematophilum]
MSSPKSNNGAGKQIHHARVQILSDLHLEFGQQYASYTFPASAPLLLLGGDTGRLVDYDEYLGFLKAQVRRYDKVFLVLGNHEFHGLGYEGGLEAARRLVSEPALCGHVILLHRARWDDTESGLTILGCTLWSRIPECAYRVVESKVKDFRNIPGWSVEKHNKLHAEEKAWLREQVLGVAAEGGREVLVATHHAPAVEGTSRPQHEGNPWTCAFASDVLDEEGRWDGVRVWVFGHTHYSTLMVRGSVRLVANQRGYVLGERRKGGDDGFDAGLAITM